MPKALAGQTKPRMGRPPKFERSAAGADEMRAKGEAYFSKCLQSDEVPTMVGLAQALGYADRASLFDAQERPEFSGAIKSLRSKVTGWWERRLAGNACTGAIFWLKNNGGYRDQQDSAITIGGDAKNPVQLLVTFKEAPAR